MVNPWEAFTDKHPVGSAIEGEIKSITEFGLFIGLDGGVDGLVHMSDLDWNKPPEEAVQKYKKGEIVRAKVLDVSVEKERISLGIKQLENDPFADVSAKVKKGDTVTCTVTAVRENGIDVTLPSGWPSFTRRSDLSRDRADQRPDRFAVGDKIDAKITSVDHESRRVTVSIKALEVDEEKEAMAQYGSSDSGASLGDILGAAIKNREQAAAAAKEEDKK
jgi:small subunit ribosomal protein S1